MRKTLLETAMRLMQGGVIPSVTDVAEAAEVSRATAYRYFPSQAALIQAAVDEALGPILGWTSSSPDAENRIVDLFTFAYPRMDLHEATLRAALWLALDQWTRRQAGTLGVEAPLVRGNRIGLLSSAVAPLRGRLGRPAFDRMVQALSLVFGTESMVVLKDIWGLDRGQLQKVAVWAALALVRAALAEAAEEAKRGPRLRAARPRKKKEDDGHERPS